MTKIRFIGKNIETYIVARDLPENCFGVVLDGYGGFDKDDLVYGGRGRLYHIDHSVINDISNGVYCTRNSEIAQRLKIRIVKGLTINED